MMHAFFRATAVASLALVPCVTGCGSEAHADGDWDGTTEEAATSALTSASVTAPGFKYAFENWDHDGANVDNPVALIFVSTHADLVSRVYTQVETVGLTHSGSKMELSGVGGSRPGVNPTDPWSSESAGRKGAFGCWGQCSTKADIHVRTYGPDGRDGTQVYQGSDGVRPYYLIATVHYDVNENTPQADFGYQDEARGLLVAKMVGAKTWRVLGSVNVKNACNQRLNKSHKCEHDGTAQIVSIDG
jgi:hypothetical protein